MAMVAEPPSPHAAKFVGFWHVCNNWPATVDIVPELLIIRTAADPASAMKMLPVPSSATLVGKPSIALLAGPPSPQGKLFDVQATPGFPAIFAISPGCITTPATVICELCTLTTRITRLLVSAI